MRTHYAIVRLCALSLLSILVLSNIASAQSGKKGKYVCAEANPESLCNAANTCGSASTPCTVNVKRTANGVSATADTPQKKSNAFFCVQPGTQITFKTASKNTGFLVDFGPNSPFDDPDAISGGSKREAQVKAVKSGCYRYSFGACVSGAISGMCRSGVAEAVVTKTTSTATGK
jgi:hypothetical protein